MILQVDVWQPLEQVLEVRERIEVVSLGRLHDAVNRHASLGPLWGVSEEPVLAFMCLKT